MRERSYKDGVGDGVGAKKGVRGKGVFGNKSDTPLWLINPDLSPLLPCQFNDREYSRCWVMSSTHLGTV